jgi:hypothetical protein
MMDTGWVAWADCDEMPYPDAREFADSAIEFIQKKPQASVKWRLWKNTLVMAVRGEDGTIMAFRASVKEERTIHAAD